MSTAPAARTVAPRATTPDATPAVKLSQVWPEVWALVRPRRFMLGVGLVLMAVNRVSGLVLPWSTKSLIDDVIG
jgi:subfamily B ATP-binding cassette protein MsbA